LLKFLHSVKVGKNLKAGIIYHCVEKFLKSGEVDIIQWCEDNREKLQKEFKPKGLFYK